MSGVNDARYLIVGPNRVEDGAPSGDIAASAPGASIQSYFMFRNMRKLGYRVDYQCLFSPQLSEGVPDLRRYAVIFVVYYNIALFRKHRKIYLNLRRGTSGRIVHYHDGNCFRPPAGFYRCFDHSTVLLRRSFDWISRKGVLYRLIRGYDLKLPDHVFHVPIGVDSECLHIGDKAGTPTVIIDHDRRRLNNRSKLASVLDACRAIKAEREMRVVLMQEEDPVADECILEPILFSEFYRKLNASWIYITTINGSYELTATESQMAGNHVIGIEGTLHDDHFVEGETGFQVRHDVERIREAILRIIDHFDPSAPRRFAFEHFSWEKVIPRLLRSLPAR